MKSTTELTSSERGEVFLEAILTLTVIFFIFLSIILLSAEIIDRPFKFLGEAQTLRYYFSLTSKMIKHYYQIVTTITIMLSIYVTYHRVKRRVRSIRLSHVLDNLHYIAQGNYDKRIPETDLGELTDVVTNINMLVDGAVEAMEEERKVEQTKDELIANVSHDIRTPLTSIVGYLDLIEHKRYNSQEQLEEYVHIAYQKALSMRNLVNDLFMYTDSLQASTHIEKQRVPMGLFFSQLAAEFELEAANKGIKIVVDVSPKELEGYFDVDKLVRVFGNLISNALKYGYGADLVRLKAYSNDNNTIFEVRNNGEVLKSGEYTRVFERSYRTDNSRHSDQPGSGLGLAIVKNLVNLHQGTVYATVENNETIFRILLPSEGEEESNV